MSTARRQAVPPGGGPCQQALAALHSAWPPLTPCARPAPPPRLPPAASRLVHVFEAEPSVTLDIIHIYAGDGLFDNTQGVAELVPASMIGTERLTTLSVKAKGCQVR